ncbi:MAG: TolB family protein [Opitutaceae bacterium]
MPRLLLFITLVVCAASRAAEPSLITVADLLKLKQLDAPALSPDGRRVVYVVKSIEPRADTPSEWDYRTHLWIAATDSSSPPRQLTFGAGGDGDPVWSPQGDRLAFTRSAERGRGQIYLLPLDGGEAAPLTKVETGATRVRWSPDGKRILFSSSLTPAQVRAALEKAGANTAPGWGTERPGRKPNDTKAQAARGRGTEAPVRKGGPTNGSGSRSGGGGAAASPANANRGDAEGNALAGADGSLAERREWLARN